MDNWGDNDGSRIFSFIVGFIALLGIISYLVLVFYH